MGFLGPIRRQVNRGWTWLRGAVPGLVRDFHVYGGLFLFAYGVSEWWTPGGYIAVGLTLGLIGAFGLPRLEDK